MVALVLSQIVVYVLYGRIDYMLARETGFNPDHIVWEENDKFYECSRFGGPTLADRWHTEISRETASKVRGRRAVQGVIMFFNVVAWAFVFVYVFITERGIARKTRTGITHVFDEWLVDD